MATCYVQYIVIIIFIYISTKNTLVYKKKQHHIYPPFSRLISIFKTNYCITWQGIKAYLQPGVPRTWNIWISYDMSPAAPRPRAARPRPTAGLQSPWSGFEARSQDAESTAGLHRLRPGCGARGRASKPAAWVRELCSGSFGSCPSNKENA